MTLVGPTSSGKTHLALTLALLRPYSLVIATKRRDPLLESLGWHRVTNLREQVVWDGDRRHPMEPRIIYWPQPAAQSAQARQAEQARAIREALNWADETGGWALVLDETMWVSRTLGLERELESLWFQGRTQGVSVISAAQRPSHVPLLAFSQASYIGLWQTSDRRDLERLREIASGFPKETIEETVKTLDWQAHELLWIDVRRRELARVSAPATIGAVA